MALLWDVTRGSLDTIQQGASRDDHPLWSITRRLTRMQVTATQTETCPSRVNKKKFDQEMA